MLPRTDASEALLVSTQRRAMLPRRSGPVACVEASEVLLKLGQESIGHPSLLAVPREDGPCIPGQLELSRVLKQLKYFWNLPRNQLASIVEQLFMRFSKMRDHAVQDDSDFLRVMKFLKYF